MTIRGGVHTCRDREPLATMPVRPVAALALTLAALAAALVTLPATPAAADTTSRRGQVTTRTAKVTTGCPMSIIGHRGTEDGGVANNTIAAFRQAVTDGVDVLELDIHRTKPDRSGAGTWVVNHDPTIDGRSIASTSFATLRRLRPDLPTYRQALTYVASTDRYVQVEVKPKSVSTGSLRYLARTATTLGLSKRFELDSSRRAVLAKFRGLHTGMRTGYILRRYVAPSVVAPVATTAVVRHSVLTAAWSSALHQAGLAVEIWTVDTAAGWATAAAYGVDGIITDQAAALVAWCEVPV